jgi:signal transduction histidine kinase
VGFVLLIGGVGPTFQPGDEAIALQVSRIASIGLGRLRAEEATKAARGELREFSYAVAHNLRAPLRALSGFSTMLVEDYTGRLLDESGVKLLGRMNEAAGRMDSLIQALLSYTRLTHEEFPLGPVPLQAAIEEAIRKAKAAVIAGDVTVQRDSVAFTVLGHPFLLGEALRHLLENAFKYTRREQSAAVAVRCEERGDRIRLWVEDHVPGIAPEHRERIFWLFELLTPEDATSGIGVGLPIARKAVERMRGRYGVESEVGVGSRFWIELRRLPRST